MYKDKSIKTYTLTLQCKHLLQMQSTELRLTISVKTFMYRCNSYMPRVGNKAANINVKKFIEV